jgi:hypothetical protein
MMQQISESKSLFFQKINKIYISLAKLTKRKWNIQILKIRDEKGDITTNTNEIQRLIRKYFETIYIQLYIYIYKTSFNIITAIFSKPIANIILHEGKLK